MGASIRYIRCVLLLFVASVLCGQEYATTNDGSRLFFTHYYRMVGTDQSLNHKLFSWDAENGVQLVYDLPDGSLSGISVTGDGSFAAFQVWTGGGMSHGELLNLRTGEVEILAEGSGRRAIISRNGRYLFTGDALVDRFSGTSRPMPRDVDFVGDDGSLLYQESDSFHRIDPDGTHRTLVTRFLNGRFFDASADATKAIIAAWFGPRYLLDTITGQSIDLVAAGASNYTSALLSSDGQWLTFTTDNRPDDRGILLLCHSDATGCQTVGDPPLPGAAVAISGDGRTLYAGEGEFVISHVDVSTGRVERAFGVAYGGVHVSEPFVRGSLVRFNPIETADRITINGREAPLLSPPGARPVVQIPWDLEAGQVQFTVSGSASPFEMTTRYYDVADFSPDGFVPGNPGFNEGYPAYREDWSATTVESPASPGEIVHIYAVGLGEVDCPIETGQPAPVDPLCRITRNLDWTWRKAGWTWWKDPTITEPAEVLFAGLAPGMVGVYQIDVRAPHHNGHQYVELSVGADEPSFVSVRIRTGSRLDQDSCGFSQRCPTPDSVRRPSTSRGR